MLYQLEQNQFLYQSRCKRKARCALDNFKGTQKIVNSSDAYFCCNELEEGGFLDMINSYK